MEQRLKGLKVAAAAKSDLAAARAMEKAAQRPQLQVFDNEVEDNSAPAVTKGGAVNEAGLARVVGRGRPKKKAPAKASRSPSPENEVMMEGGAMHGGASHQGKMLAEHLGKMHGSGWLKDFAKGLLSGVKTVGDVVSNIPGPVGMIGKLAKGAVEAGERMGESAAESATYNNPKRGRGRPRKLHGGAYAGNQVAHAGMDSVYDNLPGSGLGGQDVPPGGLAPMAYGNVPQAPASFQRNTVGMGKPMKEVAFHTHGGAKPKRAPSHRAKVVAQVMKEKGMKLGEASKYVKEHGLA